MKAILFLTSFLFCTVLFSGCNKNDDGQANQCLKNENFFEAKFDNQTIEPHYAQGGGFGLYTLYLERCYSNEDNWLLSINTEDTLSLYLNLTEISENSIYSIGAGNLNHLALDCDNTTSLYIYDETVNSNIFISSNNGQLEITRYDRGLGIIIGSFTAEMVSTTDPSIKKTITGEFNLNKSKLDNTKKPCWL